MVGKLRRLLGAKVRVVWIVLLLVVALVAGGYVAYDWTRKTSVCDAQSHPEVAYAFTFGDDNDEFYVFEESHSGVVYEVDTLYSPPLERLEREKGWRRVPSGDYLGMWTEAGTYHIYPGEDYATFSEHGSNETERVEISDCAGSDVL